MGEPPKTGFPASFRNECNFMKPLEDDGTAMDDPRPTGPTESSNDFQGESEPASATSTNARNDSFGDQPNWLSLHQNTDQGTDVQRTLQGLALGNIPQSTYRPGDLNSSGYGNSESSTGADTGLSPDTNHSTSNRPTPNASTPSDTRPNLQSGQSGSGGTSYATSPASNQSRLPTTDGRSMSSFFANQPDYSNIIPATGLTPDNTFAMPETPGRGFDVPSGWEMSNQATTGLTPVGEGVFRTLMGLGPMDPMLVIPNSSSVQQC
jgi:hypothetical protein